MITKKSRLQLATALCGAFIFGDAVFANAATVVFPQQQQPGKAIAMNTTDRFVLSNNLFRHLTHARQASCVLMVVRR